WVILPMLWPRRWPGTVRARQRADAPRRELRDLPYRGGWRRGHGPSHEWLPRHVCERHPDRASRGLGRTAPRPQQTTGQERKRRELSVHNPKLLAMLLDSRFSFRANDMQLALIASLVGQHDRQVLRVLCDK